MFNAFTCTTLEQPVFRCLTYIEASLITPYSIVFNLQQIRHIGLSIFITGRYQLKINKKIAYKKSTNIKS